MKMISIHQAQAFNLISASTAAQWGRLGVTSIEATLGAVEAASRHLEGIGPALVLYPRTAAGILGMAAHAGFVTECSEQDALALGFDGDEIMLASCAHRCEVRHGGGECCIECASAAGGKRRKLVSRRAHSKPCPSCVDMIRETWRDNLSKLADREAAEAIAA